MSQNLGFRQWKHHPLWSLLAFTAKCGVPTNQWTWLYEALLEVSTTTSRHCEYVSVTDNWAAESAIKANNVFPKTFPYTCGMLVSDQPPMFHLWDSEKTSDQIFHIQGCNWSKLKCREDICHWLENFYNPTNH